MDNCRNTDNSVAAGVGEQLHDGRVYSHPAGNCHYRGAGQHHSGPTTSVGSTLTEKEGGSDEYKNHNCNHTDRSRHRGIRLSGHHVYDQREGPRSRACAYDN